MASENNFLPMDRYVSESKELDEKYKSSRTRDICVSGLHSSELALSLTGVDDKTRWDRLADVAAWRYRLFEHSNDPIDLDEAIVAAEESLHAGPEVQAHQPFRWFRLAEYLYKRSKLNHKIEDINRSTALYETSEAWCQEQEPSTHAMVLRILGRNNNWRYDLTSSMEYLEYMVEAYSKALELYPDDPYKSMTCGNLATALRRRGNFTSSIGDLDAAISLMEIETPTGQDSICDLADLAATYAQRFLLTKNREDIDAAIERGLEALNSSESSSTLAKLHAQYCLSCSLGNRFEEYGNPDDNEEALRLSEDLEVALRLESGLNETGRFAGPAAQQVLATLALLHSRKFNAKGDIEDLNSSLDYSGKINQHPQWDFGVSARLSTELLGRYGRVTAVEDINKAIGEITLMLESMSPDDARWNLHCNLLSEFHYRRSLRTESLEDMDKSIHIMHQVLGELPDNHRRRSLGLAMMADKLRMRGVMLQELYGPQHILDIDKAIEKDIDDAINYLEYSSEFNKEADFNIGTSPAGSDAVTLHLARAYLSRSDVVENEIEKTRDMDHSMRVFEECFCDEDLKPIDRHLAGMFLATLHSMAGRSHAAVDVWKKAFTIVPALSPRTSSRQDQFNILQNIQGMSRLASSDALAAGVPASEALELLELGRGVIAGFSLEARADLSILDPDMASNFEKARSRFEAQQQHRAQGIPISGSVPELVQWASGSRDFKAAEQELQDIIKTIQANPKTRSFLGPPSYEEVLEALRDDIIVVVNACEQSVAFLITNQSRHGKTLNLSKLDLTELEDWVVRSKAYRPKIDISMLKWLWDTIASPVLDELGIGEPVPNKPLKRIIWIMTGPLSHFPIHAAGNYDGSSHTVMDRVVSSYSSSLKLFVVGRKLQDTDLGITGGKALLVGMSKTPGLRSLPFVTAEVQMLSKICSSMQLDPVCMTCPRHEDVVAQLSDCVVFHFAGHGQSDPLQPENSRLFLEDTQLTVSDLLDLKSRGSAPFLGVLSACLTGAIDADDLIDEGIHLVSALQLTGFRHVVGTLWQVDDKMCGDVTEKLYKELAEHGIRDSAVYMGLHNAMLATRKDWIKTTLNRGPPAASQFPRQSVEETEGGTPKPGKLVNADWIPFIHYGS
ncbi:uncharacterized protein PG998_002493 [Apiospora kogelbergensis]|uniref:uncharacterized protein n=1 Tax=Apiospora kogelbergensis TaxID=1337665 RepID=UPI00312DA903